MVNGNRTRELVSRTERMGGGERIWEVSLGQEWREDDALVVGVALEQYLYH